MTENIVNSSRQVFRSLNGLRFILAIWIAYFHVGHMFDEHGFGMTPILRLGVSRVDVFFVLSGFVLSHVYWAQRTKPFNFLDFMVARLARIYPMYLIALGLIIAYLSAGFILGKQGDTVYPISDLFKCLFFLQAIGLTETNSWNFPAWAVAAEMGGYLAFPLFIIAAKLTRNVPYVLLAIALGTIFCVEIFLRNYAELDLYRTTNDWAVLRGASVMFCGVAARSVLNVFKPNALLSVITIIASICVIVTAALYQSGVNVNHPLPAPLVSPFAAILDLASVPFVAFGAAFLMIGLARLDELNVSTGLAGEKMQELGNWSYVIFILHAPIYTILAQGLDVIGYEFSAGPISSIAFTLMAIAVAGPIYHYVEKPARSFIRNSWQKRRGRQIANAGL
ncbi:acyltransferase family protein [Hirschia maritima]|uniref:acyltransferase family protein n=1 Tax=Hirschia maritima TaxID=1121961 RepID=UPI000382BF61|nr:acyltransferase [Hirschia maritima]